MTKDWRCVRRVAHRCGGALAPENSLRGLDLAARLGFVAVEFDVMLSADGEPVLIHDETLDRTTDGCGPVAARTLAELRRLSCGKGWPGLEDEPIPTLGQALARCRAHGLLANIEIKPSTGVDSETGTVVARRALAAWDELDGAPADLLLSSFSVPALQAARRAAPLLARAWLVERIPGDWRAGLVELATVAIHCAASEATKPAFGEVLAAGVPIRCYTVNDPGQAVALLERGVSAIFTDVLTATGEGLAPRI